MAAKHQAVQLLLLAVCICSEFPHQWAAGNAPCKGSRRGCMPGRNPSQRVCAPESALIPHEAMPHNREKGVFLTRQKHIDLQPRGICRLEWATNGLQVQIMRHTWGGREVSFAHLRATSTVAAAADRILLPPTFLSHARRRCCRPGHRAEAAEGLLFWQQ